MSPAGAPEAWRLGLSALEERLAALGRVLVAFSGGADSALLAAVATRTLGVDNTRCVTAVSPSLADDDLEDCRALAREWGLRHEAVETHEMDNPAYTVNGPDRCYHCKAELLDVLAPLAAADGSVVVLGVNLDDLGEYRPGQRAARERGAAFPFVEAGLSKAAVREISRALGLRTWDKPQNACLASRLPAATPVSVGALSQVAAAEAALRRLGFAQVRVRHYGPVARIEVERSELARTVELAPEVTAAVKAAGYDYVTVDLEGFRSGNLSGNARTGTAAAGVARRPGA